MNELLRRLIPADIISIRVAQHKEVAADRADVFVVVTGSSLVSGTQALQKAREVANLVSELKQIGVGEEYIFLQNVHAQVVSGTFLKSSQATYTLRIHCSEIGRLVDTVGVVTSQKNARLQRIEWKYPDDSNARNIWLQRCIAETLEKAKIVAASLGVVVIGVQEFRDIYRDEEDRHAGGDFGVATVRQRKTVEHVTPEDLGLEVSHSKQVHLSVEVGFRVSAMQAPASG